VSAAVLPAPVAPAPRPPAARHDPYADGDGRFEVVRGVRVEKQPMGLIENLIASILQGRLEPFCRENDLGRAVNETMFALPGWNDRKPDVAFVSYARWAAARPLPRVNAWPVAPDLAVEVISPTDKAFDVVDKVREYFAAGVRRVWHVYSNVEQVFVFDSPTAVRVLARGDELDGDPVVPGFRLPVADVFPLAEPAA
jgi:Uma2 family endonuclease